MSNASLCAQTTKKFEHDHIFKLMLIGDSAVGKTCLMLRFSERAVPRTYAQTIGIDFRVRTVALDGKVVKLQIWDTAGQERFRTITSACYRGAAGVIFVYDITKRSSFENVTSWVHSFEKHITEKTVSRILVGNKCDLSDLREVLPGQGQELAESIEASFMETSALKDINVDEMFMVLARKLIAQLPKTDTTSTPSSPLKLAAKTLKKAELNHPTCCR